MIYPELSFDAVLIAANKVRFEVDCSIALPLAVGQKADIHISVIKGETADALPQNPCRISGQHGAARIELDEIWYRRFSLPPVGRKHGRGEVELTHVGSITVWAPSATPEHHITFFLSPAVYFQRESGMVEVSSHSPTEIVRLYVSGLGEGSLGMYWHTKYERHQQAPGARSLGGYSIRFSVQENEP